MRPAANYSIGIDFGTESGRALQLDLGSGDEVASVAVRYASGVLDERLPDTGEPLPTDWALQDPADWQAVVNDGVTRLLSESGIATDRVLGIGVDFTSCTVLPVTQEGVPLCTLERWRPHKHAWPKLPAVGDMLAWMVRRIAPTRSYDELERACVDMGAGQTGLLALDWWNGNRTIIGDADLTGAVFGLGLSTTLEQLYRALLEAIAFGNRRIMDNFEEHGLPQQEIVACGGIAHRSPLMMQLLADTSGRPVHVPASREIPARGAALFGAVAAGHFASISEAVHATRLAIARTYTPDPNAKKTFDEVYAVYRELYDIHGRTSADLMHRLKAIRVRSWSPGALAGVAK